MRSLRILLTMAGIVCLFNGSMGCLSQMPGGSSIDAASGLRFDENAAEQEPKKQEPLQTLDVGGASSTGQGLESKMSSSKKVKHYRGPDELLLFFPSKYPDGDWKPAGLKFEDVWFTADDKTKLHGWYCPVDKPTAYVVYAHGNGGHLAHRAELLRKLQQDLNVTVFIFDYRGYGRSEGKVSVSGAISDGRAASSYLAERAGVKESELVLMGRSLGGAIMTQVASDTQPRKLVIESSFASLKGMGKLHYPYLSWLVSKNKLDSETKIKNFQGALLQSHGTADRLIPFESGKALFDAASEPKIFIEIQGRDHNDAQPSSYYDQLKAFLK